MTLLQKAPAGPRPANSPTRLRGAPKSNRQTPTTSNSTNILSLNAPMLSAPTINKSRLPFDRADETGHSAQSTGPYDFEPSVSFDDLHTSIESGSTEFKLTQFPSPPGDGSILEARSLIGKKFPDNHTMTQSNGISHGSVPPLPNRPGRSGSLLRRPSSSSRQPGASSIASPSPTTLNASAAPTSVRNRRQSHYPPVSNSIVSKQPRQSMGPGVIPDPDASTLSAHTRRPSLLGDKTSSRDSTRRSLESGSAVSSDLTSGLPLSRATKAKSVHSSRSSQVLLLGVPNDLTPEQHRFSPLTSRSPRVSGKPGTPSSNGSKRMSMMPGNHATGLGARTISPTDTRRMKRLSAMPQSQSMNILANIPPPPPPVSMEMRADSRSPSMIPRKSSLTPSSARTTPDMNNRKSYSSGLSIGSTTSFNSVRTSTGSIQPRLPPSFSTTRLPAPKLTPSTMQAEDDEDVPPVPAIPKAYESPKESPAEAYFTEKKKSSRSTADTPSTYGNSTSSISMLGHAPPSRTHHGLNNGKPSYGSMPGTEVDKASQARKQLEPLRLPPLNLGPLNIPTPKLGDQNISHREFCSPVSRNPPKAPTTPMTASKTSFFSKGGFDETVELPSLRSSTSVHQSRRMTPTPPDGNTSESGSSLLESHPKSSISPFLSSSLPKSGFEPEHLKRSKTGGDYMTVTGNFFDAAPQIDQQTRANLPNAPELTKDRVSSKPPPQETARQEPQSPSSKSTLRRKLSLSWKRGASKSGVANGVDGPDSSSAQKQIQSDNMPPPRIPASQSAHVGSFTGLKQPSSGTSVNLNSLGQNVESRRRKSSAASITNYSTRDRVKSDTWNAHKEGADAITVPPTRSASGSANKVLRPKSSATVLRTVSSWTSELDKDDMAAEDEMRKLGSRRKETEIAGRTLDALKKRATMKERVGPQDAIRIAMLNIYERGEIIDYTDVYFCGTQNARKVVGNLQSDAPNFGYDDERGDYTIVSGDHLAYRYEIVDVLGKGSFGQVVRCIDHKLGVLVAVKIIRNKKRFHQQALVEVNILQKLREWDPKNKHSMVNFTQSFYFRGHLCISTELLDMNLYEFIKAHSFRGFSLRIIRRFTKQILSSLVLLKQRKVIHCDLKPENILLRHPLRSELKVIDFGSSCFEHEKVYTYIQSRFYRSPEVILGMTYGMPIDMWSVGCILAELYTGVPIFPGENEQEQLACIMEVFGPPEKHLIEKSTRKKLFFDSMGKPRLTVSSKGRRRRPSSKTLQQALKCDDDAFLDFIARCLRWDPERRLRPEDAIRHEFITGQKPLVPVPRMPTRDSSPTKRANSISTPRPLPEPPSLQTKGIVNPMRSGISPHKAVSGASRRTSGATAATAASINRRTSAGGSISSISGLPRAAGRVTSGKQDLAAAGASVAMRRA